MSKLDNILLNGTIYNLGGEGLTDDIKDALLQIAQKVAYIDEDGQDYYDELYAALYPQASPISISATYTQSGTVYDTASLNDLKANLVVTAYFSDGTIQAVIGYTLSGTLTEGTSTITVSYGGKTTTFTVTVTHMPISDETRWSDGVAYAYDYVGHEYVDRNTGAFGTDNAYARTPYLYCDGASSLSISCSGHNDLLTNSNTLYNVFYDANKQFVSRFDFKGLVGTQIDSVTITIPSNVSYFACSSISDIFANEYLVITPNA